jgi:hypothetical protein
MAADDHPHDLPPRGDFVPPAAAPGPRQTLALRLAARNRQRELRAERLARLRPPPEPAPTPPGAPSADAAPADSAGALEDFLKALTGHLAPLPEGPPVEPGELLPFARPAAPAAAAPAGDLDRLPGVGPGLVWALERAGLRRLADIAPLAPGELAARLGPLGRLVPADRWIAVARAAAD